MLQGRRQPGALGAVAAVGMFVVLLMGETVTTTGSGTGCGRSWPLCQGQVMPPLTIHTLIELGHRAVTGLESVVLVAFSLAAWTLRRRRPALRLLVPAMLAFLLLQAAMGAAADLYPEVAAVLALHFGISLLAVASTVLAAQQVWEPVAAPISDPGPRLRLAVWGLGLYLCALVYSGALVVHIGAAGSCPSWPACLPSSAPSAVSMLHRAAGSLAGIGAAGLVVVLLRPRPRRADLVAGGVALLVAILLQGAAGAYLVLAHFSLVSELIHAALAAAAFTAAAWLCLRVAPRRLLARTPAGLDFREAGPYR